MRLFQKKSDPKKLSIKGAWWLYKNLKDGLTGRKPENYLMDEVLSTMDKIDTESFKASLRVMFGDEVNYLEKTPVDLALMFVQGLKKNNAFDFFDFIGTLSRGTSKR